ncbi:hypothetical protein L3X38_025173 [Prunus dulcis]|uniref:Uncharacterized protein n=1 Tax=Prunus dulcis TaxID=3755 RepID=A0AAD4W162_PRUDU|nr:hypothetical protein L3X38_025173 [Prunus dulcis]
MRQSLAIGITELISAWMVDLGNLIGAFQRRTQGAHSRVFGGQNLAHDPVAHPEGTRFHLGVIVPADTLFVGGVAHAGLVKKFFDEVKVLMPTTHRWLQCHRWGFSGLQRLLDDFIHRFDLAIRLGVGWGGKAKTYLKVRTQLFKFFIVKLPGIVCDDSVGDAKATYNILPDECFDASCGDGCQGFSFSPLGEVVYNSNCVLYLAFALMHRSDKVQSPLGKWPRTDHGSQWFTELRDVGKSLCEGLSIGVK